ncbi:MAG: FAD/NAD(P)-binding oxidoreductase [Chloroflexota bacterium]
MPASRPDVDAAFDLLVIGAGPAGLAAAAAAATSGLERVALLDAGSRPGGQFWRHRKGDTGRGHHDWRRFQDLVGALRRHQRLGVVRYLPDHPVWHLEPSADGGFTAHVVHGGAARELQARAVVIATGAYDRQLPFPGWALPGVFTAGAVQALLKGQGVLAGRRIVVSGTGPFLLPVAASLVSAGADVAAVLEANRPSGAARHPVVLARNRAKVAEAAAYLATLARHRVPYHTGRAVVAAHGEGEVHSVTSAALDADWRIVAGSEQRIACDAVAVGFGFTPQVELAADLGCAMALDADGSLVVTVDAAQQSSVEGAFVAGEACGVGGQALALVEGEIAGVAAAARLSGANPAPSADLARRREGLRAFAALLPRLWPVRPGWQTWLADDTLVCRCEEVPAAAIRAAVTELGASDARGAKLFSRAGMGACQGRICGSPAACLTAEALGRGVTADDLSAHARRPIAWPITLGALAADDALPRDATAHLSTPAAHDPPAAEPQSEEAPA